MADFAKGKFDFSKQTPEQKEAMERMADLPTGEGAEAIFVQGVEWVVSLGTALSLLAQAHPLCL
jgi:hypothetical protein